MAVAIGSDEHYIDLGLAVRIEMNWQGLSAATIRKGFRIEEANPPSCVVDLDDQGVEEVRTKETIRAMTVGSLGMSVDGSTFEALKDLGRVSVFESVVRSG